MPVLDPPAALAGSSGDAKFTVEFLNNRAAPLYFDSMVASCSCLVCDPVQRELLPGGRGQLRGTIRLPLGGRDSHAGANLIIKSKTGTGETVESRLSINLPVRPPIEYPDPAISVEGTESLRTTTKTFTQFALAAESFVEPLVNASGNFSARRVGDFGKIESGKHFKSRTFQVRFEARDATVVGGHGGMVSLVGNVAGARLEMPVDWVDALPFAIQPATLALRYADAKKSAGEAMVVSTTPGIAGCFIAAAAEEGSPFTAAISASDPSRLVVAMKDNPTKAVVAKVRLQVRHDGREYPATLGVLCVPSGIVHNGARSP